MYQGTTPSVIYGIKGYNLTTATVYVYFKGKNGLLKKSGSEVSVAYDSDNQKSIVYCSLTQEETLAMKKGSVLTQIRFIYQNGQAYATNTKPLEVSEVIEPEVIEYQGGEST